MTVRAPAAPGKLGERIDPALLQSYVADLGVWVAARKQELDEIDVASSAAGGQEALTSDLVLAMALWQAVSERNTLVVSTWDGGRVGPVERERLSSLIWGRLDDTIDSAALARAGAPNALAVSLPEACRLSDAVTSQLRTKLALDPAADENAVRIKTVRASLERIRDQIGLEPASRRERPTTTLNGLTGRLSDIAERASRGADVGGLLGPLELDVATLERDLIVGNARRRELASQVVAARETYADLLTRQQALHTLAEQCVQRVEPAPRYAVPDVRALGEPPVDPAQLSAYRARLERVGRALQLAQREYAQALADADELASRLELFVSRSAALGLVPSDGLQRAEDLAREVLSSRPMPMPVAGAVVELYRVWADWAAAEHPSKESA